jgi:hypothetical protein
MMDEMKDIKASADVLAGILKEAKSRMEDAIDADQDNRTEALDDLRALAGLSQWPDDVRADREAAGKPCLMVNQLPQFLRQVTGDIRSTNPSIKVVGADSGADEFVAEVYEGLIRHIQNRSDASSVYERAAESAAACGMGYWRILADYRDETSFNQELRIENISNPFSVYFDPAATLSTREDANWCLITQTLEDEEFERLYPDAASMDVDNDGTTDNLAQWRDGDNVMIAEYFWKEPKPIKLYLLADGTTLVDPEKPPTDFVRERDGTKTVVKWAKISGKEVLEGPQEIPGKYIPVVAVMGEELYAGDRIYRSSVIRHAKGPQAIFNIMWSTAVEVAAMQPKSPWLVTAKHIAGFEQQWASPDANKTTLLYNPDPASPGPQRIQPPLSSQALGELLNRSAMELRSTTGIQDAALGQRSSESSGVAIRQRQQESDNSTSIYVDNMGKGIAHTGRILIDSIPRVYDSAQAVMIVGKEGDAKVQPINQIELTPEGPRMVDLSKGQYTLEADVGPNYMTKRQAASDGMMQFMSAIPNAAPMVADLVAKAQDWPGADQFAERLKPQGLPGDEQQPDPMQQQAMQQQMMMQQRQMEAANIAQELEIRIQTAKALEAEAQAQEAQWKAMRAQAELRAGAAGMMPAPMQG